MEYVKYFDSKTFNPSAFTKYVRALEKLRLNRLLNSGAIYSNPRTVAQLGPQTAGNYITTPIHGRIGGEALNYDGTTDIKADKTRTYSHSKVVVGRAKAWTEMDFAYDITGGENFMDQVGEQVADYWADVDEDILLAVLDGVFKMTGADNKKFVDGHTYETDKPFGPTTLNIGMQKALGDQKGKFAMAIMHSAVATHLENLNVLEYLKYTDSQGMQIPTNLATLNGRLVLVDDTMPVKDGKYTTYVLGQNAIELTNVGAKIPFEMARDPYTGGGEDTLISRQRKVYSPNGISFTMKNVASESPTNAELADGANWELASGKDGEGKASTIDHRHIPIARIVAPLELEITPDVKMAPQPQVEKEETKETEKKGK